MKNVKILFVIIFLITFQSYSQSIKNSISSFVKQTKAKISYNRSIEIPTFVNFPINNGLSLDGNTLKNKVDSFLEKHKEIFAIKNSNESLKDGKVKIDNYGLKHYILKQFYNDVPVYDAQLRFHFNHNKNLTSINGTIIPDIRLNTTPTLNMQRANEIALEIVNKSHINQSSAPLKIIDSKLYIYPKGLVQGYTISNHLVYRVEVHNDLDVREFLFIDAHNGKLIEQFTGIAHAINRVLYEDDTTDKRWEEGQFFPGFLDEWQQTEVTISGHIYHFFNNAFSFKSYDGEDAQMVTINNNPTINCPNASWNGTSANFCTGTASDDIVAHEWAHAYTGGTSNLVYAYESGAINEAYSDIWGETIDLINNYNDDGEDLSLRANGISLRWQMGEDATAFGASIRDMWNPTLKGDPGKISDTQYNCDISLNDNGGVHTNSGIPNHAYALLVDGGTYNGQTINALGFTKAAHIFWRAQSEYLTRFSDFNALANALESACADLVGINLEGLSITETPAGLSGEVITTSDCLEVTKALIAVELKNDNNCLYPTLLTPPNSTLCSAATSNPIFYEDWESGFGSWSISQLPENPGIWEPRDWVIETSLPNDRLGQGVFAPNSNNGDCDTDLQNGILRLESPVITIPNYTTGTFEMAFYHSVSTEPDYDGGNIKYSLDGGAWTILPRSAFTENDYNLILNNTNNTSPMRGEAAFSGLDTGSLDSIWARSVINLSSIGIVANSTLKLRWELGSDGCAGALGWFLDDIAIYNCDEALSINDFDSLDNNITIYPNPSTSLFNIEMKNISSFSYEIYDIIGKKIVKIKKISSNSFQLDLSNYSKGIYFFRLYHNDKTLTKKLILN